VSRPAGGADLLALHAHFRRIDELEFSPIDGELLAEKIAVILSGDPEACKSKYSTIIAVLKRDSLDGIIEGMIKGTDIHPSVDTYCKIIDHTAERMKTPEARRLVEDEIATELKAEHQKLFPHHFNRPLGNTRA
jgi:hypothetical protein